MVTVRESALKADSGAEKNPLSHRGIEPVSLLRLAFRFDALPTELSGCSVRWIPCERNCIDCCTQHLTLKLWKLQTKVVNRVCLTSHIQQGRQQSTFNIFHVAYKEFLVKGNKPPRSYPHSQPVD